MGIQIEALRLAVENFKDSVPYHLRVSPKKEATAREDAFGISFLLAHNLPTLVLKRESLVHPTPDQIDLIETFATLTRMGKFLERQRFLSINRFVLEKVAFLNLSSTFLIKYQQSQEPPVKYFYSITTVVQPSIPFYISHMRKDGPNGSLVLFVVLPLFPKTDQDLFGKSLGFKVMQSGQSLRALARGEPQIFHYLGSAPHAVTEKHYRIWGQFLKSHPPRGNAPLPRDSILSPSPST